MTRLSRARPQIPSGIVHFGPGAFFRAFLATYTQDAMDAAGGDWGITAVSLKSTGARDALEPQGCAFTAVELGPDGRHPRVIDAISRILVAPDDPSAVIAAMVDSTMKVVTLTITEKGYCLNPTSGRLNLDHPEIRHDQATPAAPKTAPGFLVAALQARRNAGIPPFAVLSCDNLPANGALTRQAVLDFAKTQSADLADWIADTVEFPSTMVDRITPATTHQDLASLAAQTGVTDPAAVFHEPFRQWVIEDFQGPRPAWDRAGAQFVRNVEAHEVMKLRCLNGTHSTLAYLGYLAGFETIAECVADPDIAAFLDVLWREEILPTVPKPQGEDLTLYTTALLARYSNASIHHRTWQIAMDGSQKLPQRLLSTISDNLNNGQDCPGLCLAVAAWMRYVGGVDEKGQAIDVRDPLADALRAAVESATTPAQHVAALLDIDAIFDPSLAATTAFRSSLERHLTDLTQIGALGAIRQFLKSRSTG